MKRTSLALVAVMTAGLAHANPIRIAPVRIAPLHLPSVIVPLIPARMPSLRVLPVMENPWTPSINLPGVPVPVVQPTPIEKPDWPVAPLGFKQVQPLSKSISSMRAKLGFDKNNIPSEVRLHDAYDGSNIAEPVKDERPVEIPSIPSRPSIDHPSSPMTLPEDDLLRELGF